MCILVWKYSGLMKTYGAIASRESCQNREWMRIYLDTQNADEVSYGWG